MNIKITNDEEEEKVGASFKLLTNRAKPRLVSTRNKTSTFKKGFNPVISGTKGAEIQIDTEE